MIHNNLMFCPKCGKDANDVTEIYKSKKPLVPNIYGYLLLCMGCGFTATPMLIALLGTKRYYAKMYRLDQDRFYASGLDELYQNLVIQYSLLI